jgi:hypothetical protein
VLDSYALPDWKRPDGESRIAAQGRLFCRFGFYNLVVLFLVCNLSPVSGPAFHRAGTNRHSAKNHAGCLLPFGPIRAKAGKAGQITHVGFLLMVENVFIQW